MTLAEVKELHEMGFSNDQIMQLAAGGNDEGTQPKDTHEEKSDIPDEPKKPEDPTKNQPPEEPKEKNTNTDESAQVGQLLEEVKALKGLIQNQNKLNSFIGSPKEQSVEDILCNFVNPTYKKEVKS